MHVDPTVLGPVSALLGAVVGGCGSMESLIPHFDPATAPKVDGANPRPTAQLPTNPAEKPIVLPVALIVKLSPLPTSVLPEPPAIVTVAPLA